MSRYILVFLLLLSATGHANDKALHFVAGVVLDDLFFRGCKTFFHLGKEESNFGCELFSFVGTGVVAGMKELSDTQPDGVDLAATIGGGVTRKLIRIVVEF